MNDLRKDTPLFQPTDPAGYRVPQDLLRYSGELKKALGQFITPERLEKLERVVQARSRRVLTVFENTHHAHNISAILRNVESQGFMEVLFLYSNPDMRFRAQDNIDRGASQWLLPKRSSSLLQTATFLKNAGYKIAVVSLPDFSKTAGHFQKHVPLFASHELHSQSFLEFIGSSPVALIFGTELYGVSEEWFHYADLHLCVKMHGFTESLNVSVCAGILLQALRVSLVEGKKNSYLSAAEQELVLEHWVAKSCTRAGEIISERFAPLKGWYEFIKKSDFFMPFEKK